MLMICGAGLQVVRGERIRRLFTPRDARAHGAGACKIQAGPPRHAEVLEIEHIGIPSPYDLCACILRCMQHGAHILPAYMRYAYAAYHMGGSVCARKEVFLRGKRESVPNVMPFPHVMLNVRHGQAPYT
jgi:hypothetical protein